MRNRRVSKLLAKTLKDAVRENRLVAGARQVMNGAGDSSLVVLSESNGSALQRAAKSAEAAGVPTIKYGGTSVALGKLCGLQFRVSALSLTGVDESVVQSLVKENE